MGFGFDSPFFLVVSCDLRFVLLSLSGERNPCRTVFIHCQQLKSKILRLQFVDMLLSAFCLIESPLIGRQGLSDHTLC